MQKDLNILRYEDAAACLPVRLRKAALALAEERKALAEEFRLRAGQPMTVLLPTGEMSLSVHVEPEELEQAAYRFVELYREGGEMHERGGAAVLVESVVFTEEKMEAIGIPPGTLPVGWWIGFKVLDASVWEKVKEGTYSMFSIEGEAERVEE